jgi:hypothetical protein
LRKGSSRLQDHTIMNRFGDACFALRLSWFNVKWNGRSVG